VPYEDRPRGLTATWSPPARKGKKDKDNSDGGGRQGKKNKDKPDFAKRKTRKNIYI
jgi:hypothetical protein